MLQKPQKLEKGDTIGIISPAGAVKEIKSLENSIIYMEEKGFKIKTGRHFLDKTGYLAGEDNSRLDDLMGFFKDKEVKAIFCSRGGYGTFRLLDKIDFELIRNNPKIFIGYSDVTALLCNFVEKSSLVTFHGPLLASDFGKDNIDKYTEEIFFNILENKVEIPYSFQNPYQYTCISPGKAEGILLGGNLSVLCGLLGTPYFTDLTGKIFFLEDVGEPLYKIDRMLTQLKLAGIFDNISGLILGEFSSVVKSDDKKTNSLSILEVVKNSLGKLKIPIGFGFPLGHETHKATLPLGVKYFFDSENFKLELLENYFK